jgi:hypothetical protein
VRELKPCGTVSAYKRHLYRKEPPCAACKAANTAARNPVSDAAANAYELEMTEALEANPPVIQWVPNGRGVLVAAAIYDPHTKNPRKQVAA